jgi:glycerophosphoryl diester phosphodiesterase
VSLPGGLLTPPFAHRGLWSRGEACENSLAAIERACEMGYGSEFDVRLSEDGEAVVFHDETLARMAGVDIPVSGVPVAELVRTALLGGPDRIPTFAEVLELVGGRAMLLAELKPGPDPLEVAEAAARVLDHYRGPVAVISFEPSSLGWFAAHRPETPRGLDAMWEPEDEALAAEELARMCEIARPDFLVLERRAAAGALAAAHRADGRPVIAWTLRSTEEVEAVADRCDNFIFEGFTA